MGGVIETKITVVQGAPIVNEAFIYKQSSEIVLIDVDLHSKRCEMVAIGSNGDMPVVDIGANEHTLHVDQNKERDDITEIQFDEFGGWSVYAAETSRYTLRVCLTKDQAPDVLQPSQSTERCDEHKSDGFEPQGT